MKYLSIIIPYYTESQQEMFPLLSSINNQIGIDFNEIEVIMVNDGSPLKLPQEYINIFFNLDIKVIYNQENKGAGYARQVGVDNAVGEYIMYCDADDCLHSIGALYDCINESKCACVDVMYTDFLEEYRDDNGNPIFIHHSGDKSWLFAKLFRRQFLIDNDIRFLDGYRLHEDGSYIRMCDTFADTTHAYFVNTYVWKYRQRSITRKHGNMYVLDEMVNYISANAKSLEIIINKRPDKREKIVWEVNSILALVYHYLQKDECYAVDKYIKLKKEIEKAVKLYLSPFIEYSKEISDKDMNKILYELKSKISGDLEKISYRTWVQTVLYDDKKPSFFSRLRGKK